MAEVYNRALDYHRRKPTEAVIQLNDVYVPIDQPLALDEIDAHTETQVGNEGFFSSGRYRFDAWTDAGIHLATHIADVREHQIERHQADLAREGIDSDAPTDQIVEELSKIDAKMARRAQSVGQNVVEVVINHAPRSEENGDNGKLFYVALTSTGLIFYAQQRFLMDLLRDDRIVEYYEVKNSQNGGLWPDGAQFRSAEVANTRSIPESRRQLEVPKVPEQDSPLEFVWVDGFGNVLIRAREPEKYDDVLANGGEGHLVIEGQKVPVKIGKDLDSSKKDRPTIYRNPKTTHPKIIDFAVKVDDPLLRRGHALSFIRDAYGGPLELRDLRRLQVDLEA